MWSIRATKHIKFKKMRYSKRIENVFIELKIESMIGLLIIYENELENVCEKHSVKTSSVLKISDGRIRIKNN